LAIPSSLNANLAFEVKKFYDLYYVNKRLALSRGLWYGQRYGLSSGVLIKDVWGNYTMTNQQIDTLWNQTFAGYELYGTI